MRDIGEWNTTNKTEKCSECGGRIPKEYMAVKENGKLKHIGCFKKVNKISRQTEKHY